MTASDRHLDLGCGEIPRNPYHRKYLYGIDIRDISTQQTFEYQKANLMLEPIPFPDNTFSSISAFNFIEHIPRVLPNADHTQTLFPFIRLMQEIWRTLEPNGLLYAVTPAYPHREAFTDPTHVNFITEETHDYFCTPDALAHMYGFTGVFNALRVQWVNFSDAIDATPGRHQSQRKLAHSLRTLSRKLRGKPSQGTGGFLLWELQAIKPSAERAANQTVS